MCSVEKKVDEGYVPNLQTLRISGFLISEERAFKVWSYFIVVVVYPLALLLIVMNILSTNFSANTISEYFFLVSSTCISLKRRIYFIRNQTHLKSLLGHLKTEPRFDDRESERLRRETMTTSKSYIGNYNWTFCTFRSIMFLFTVTAMVFRMARFGFPFNLLTASPTLAGRPVFFKMWVFNRTTIGDTEYYSIMTFQLLVLLLNQISGSAVDAFNNTVMISMAARIKVLEGTAQQALVPEDNPDFKLAEFFKWMPFYDHLEETLQRANRFSGPLMFAPSVVGISNLLIYGLEFSQKKEPAYLFIIISTWMQIFSSHNAGQKLIDEAAKLTQSVSMRPLLVFEEKITGTVKTKVMTVPLLLQASRRLRGFTADGYFRMTREFVTGAFILTSTYVIIICLVRK